MWLALGFVAFAALLLIGLGLNAWKALKLSDKQLKNIDKSKLKDWNEDGWDNDKDDSGS